MALELEKEDLVSRVVRSELVQSGIRKISLFNQLVDNDGRPVPGLSETNTGTGGISGFLGGILKAGAGLVGFVAGSIFKGLSFTFTTLLGMCFALINTLVNFNWNASDAELKSAIGQQNVTIASVWGSAAGGAFGWGVAISIGYGITYYCPVVAGGVLAKAITTGVLPEAGEEVSALFESAIKQTANSLTTQVVYAGFMGLRRALRTGSETLAFAMGDEKYNVFKEQKSQPRWTIAEKWEDFVEWLPLGQAFKAFIESFVDEAWDGFTEAGYLIAAELDAAVAQAKAGSQIANGMERVITIQPDKRVDGEVIAITGREEHLKPHIQSYINTHRLVQNRDIGQIVGMPAEDWYRGKPQRRKMTIVFKDVEKPPYYKRGSGIKSATYTIPDPKPTLSWERIKRATKAYNWGKFRCTANLDNGRQMAVYGASPQEAEEKLKDLLELSTAEIVTLSVTEEKDRNIKLKKDTTRMYPATGTMLVRRPSLDTVGRTDLDGNTWDEEHIRFDLWPDDEPEEFQFVRLGVNDAD